MSSSSKRMVGKEHPCLRKSYSIAEREKKKQIHVHCSVKIFSQIKRNKMQSYLSPPAFRLKSCATDDSVAANMVHVHDGLPALHGMAPDQSVC